MIAISRDTFSPSPLAPNLFPLHTLTNNTHVSILAALELPNLATTSNGTHQRIISTVVDPPTPNCLCATHVLPAFPTAAAGTELPADVNRSIGQTNCIGTAEDGPYAAVGIVACNRIVVLNTTCALPRERRVTAR